MALASSYWPLGPACIASLFPIFSLWRHYSSKAMFAGGVIGLGLCFSALVYIPNFDLWTRMILFPASPDIPLSPEYHEPSSATGLHVHPTTYRVPKFEDHNLLNQTKKSVPRHPGLKIQIGHTFLHIMFQRTFCCPPASKFKI